MREPLKVESQEAECGAESFGELSVCGAGLGGGDPWCCFAPSIPAQTSREEYLPPLPFCKII